MNNLRRSHLRILPRVVLAVALLGSVAAMGPAIHAQRSADSVTITYWNAWTDPVSKGGIMKTIAAFEKAYPNIKVNEVDLASGGNVSDTKILTAITGGKPPDAATMFNIRNLGAWAARGAIQDLGTLAKTYHTNLGDYTSAALNATTYKGKLYGLAIELDDFAMLINTDLFKAAGITKYPQTMSEVAADAVKLTKKDSSGRITQLGLVNGYNLDQLEFIYPYFNVQWFDAAHNKITTASPEAVQALTWEKNLVDQYGVQAYENFKASKAKNALGDHFIDGTAAMDFDGDWACNLVPAYSKNLHWIVVPPPYADGHPEWKNSTWIDGGINVIPTGASHPNEAYQFINFMNGSQVNATLNAALGGRSPTKSGDALQAKQGNACVKYFSTLMQTARAFPWPLTAVSTDLLSDVGTAEDVVLRGKDTPLHALTQIQQKLQSELNSAH